MSEEKKWYCSDCGGRLWPTCYYCNEPMTTEDAQEIKAHLEQCEKRPPSEMQQLVEWIDGMIDVDLSGDSAQQYGAHLVRDYIRTEFLGEEGADE